MKIKKHSVIFIQPSQNIIGCSKDKSANALRPAASPRGERDVTGWASPAHNIRGWITLDNFFKIVKGQYRYHGLARGYSKGFTLAELMIVAVIISILAVLTFPGYGTMKEKALDKEAIGALKLIYAGEKQYYSQNEAYFASSNLTAINNNLHLVLNSSNWAYSIASNFTNATAGPRANRTWTVSKTNSTPGCSGSCF